MEVKVSVSVSIPLLLDVVITLCLYFTFPIYILFRKKCTYDSLSILSSPIFLFIFKHTKVESTLFLDYT